MPAFRADVRVESAGIDDSAVPWPERWRSASIEADGYWRHHRVAEGFRTASACARDYAAVLLGVIESWDGRCSDRPISRVIDVGAGDGELISEIASARPGLRCLGLDLRPGAGETEPGPGRPGWLLDCWRDPSGWDAGALASELDRDLSARTLLVASEWLDEIPVPIHSDDDGELADLVDPVERAWSERWWPPVHGSGSRVEVGTSRDRAWGELIAALSRCGGVGVLIDYGHHRETRPADGSLRAFAGGRLVEPKVDGSVNLSCAVAVDAVQAAGEEAGAETLWSGRQREALAHFGARPTIERDPLTDLARRSARQALSSPFGFGDYWWLVQQVRRPPRPRSTRR